MNMSYCRFENTARALDDCLHAINEKGLSESESLGRRRILALAEEILTTFDPEIAEGDGVPDECQDCGYTACRCD